MPIRVLFSCTGVGIVNRGIESFFREAFDNLQDLEGVQATLIKGAGQSSNKEQSVWCLPRTSFVTEKLGQVVGRNGYVMEQWSSFLPIVRQIRQLQPHIIFYSDSNLGFLLYWFRRQIGVPYRLLFSNGGPCNPPFIRKDFVHQVTPLYYQQALEAGEPAHKHILVPYGIQVSDEELITDTQSIQALRRSLNLPIHRPIVLSVGAIDPHSHKRMDYLIQEIASLPAPRPYLVLLGQMSPASKIILEQASRFLGTDHFTARTVSYEAVSQYYQTADIFTLASLNEGFGRVFLEALMYGLPCIIHDHPVMRYVLGSHGCFADFSKPTSLARVLSQILKSPSNCPQKSHERRKYVRDTFSWTTLAPHYFSMFQHCLVQPTS
ncbi:glycosyltransferase [Synechococcales cyanobacterium C]|uniref:Glycosyltransferase n=1 Tax=Petrachloros mirabilis ULC683 TaxID=2781853 RepID=A0A8K2A909_9CYAN|nr:glycosyltransferase family 4 protein [Petrachloros mirabilis]NCJ07645.1 glycosyltransferase [Petrachloros mirabilis ULC683]